MRALPPLLLILLTLCALGRVIFNGFTGWDDPENFTSNSRFSPPTLHSTLQYWKAPTAGLYVPLTYTVWSGIAWASDAISGSIKPWAFHLASLIVHVIAALLTYAILRRLLQGTSPWSYWAACAGAAVFAVHPLQVETVAWASGFKDALCGMLVLLSIERYVAFAMLPAPAARSRKISCIIALLAFVLALLAKPSAVVAPAMIAIIDCLLIGRRVRRVALALLPWVALCTPAIVVARFAQDIGQLAVVPLWQRPLIAGDAVAFHLWKLLAPMNLALDYGRSPRQVMTSGVGYVTWIVPAAIAVMIITAARRRPDWRVLLAAFGLFVVGLAPTLGLAPFQFQFYSTVADHYAYLALLGPAVAVAWLVARRIVIGNVVAAAAIVLFSICSFVQAGVWRDSLTVSRHAALVNPQSAVAHNLYGAALAERGNLPQAATEFARALHINPADMAAHRALARCLANLGDIDGAIGELQESIRLNESAGGDTTGDHVLLARMLIERRQLGRAIRHLQSALQRDPNHAEARRLLEQAQRDNAGG